VLTVVPDESDGRDDRADSAAAGPVAGSSSLIDEIVREGARRMLAEALQAEVDAYIAGSRTSVTSAGAGWWCATAAISLARC
jgi:hypothetical protein